MVVDDLALLGRQRAAADAQVMHLVFVQQGDLLAVGPAPAHRADAAHPILLLGAHVLTALVGLLEEGAVVVERLDALSQIVLERRHIGAVIAAGAEKGNFGVALEDLETGADGVDAVADRRELGRLVDHVLGRGDLAAVVQPRGDVQFVALVRRKVEILEWPATRVAGGFGEHLGKRGNPLAVAPGIGRFLVDGVGDELDERIEQPPLTVDEQLVVERDRRLRRQCLDRLLVGRAEGHGGSRRRVARIYELQHADHLVGLVAHGNGEKRRRTVADLPVEGLGAGNIVFLAPVGICDIDAPAGVRDAGGDIPEVLSSGRPIVHRQRIEGDLLARAAAHGDAQAVVAHQRELEHLARHPAVDAATPVAVLPIPRTGHRARFATIPTPPPVTAAAAVDSPV